MSAMTKTRILLLAVDANATRAQSSVKRYRLAKQPLAGLTAAKGSPRRRERGSV